VCRVFRQLRCDVSGAAWQAVVSRDQRREPEATEDSLIHETQLIRQTGTLFQIEYHASVFLHRRNVILHQELAGHAKVCH
jgi:hypothetical protein